MQKIVLDKWQKEVLEAKGNLCICSGRQSGKSTIISQKCAEFAMNNSNKSIMVIAAVERQAYLLFEKILAYIYSKDKKMIMKKKDKPTKSQLKLTNGSIIRCLPTGDSGYGIRGFTIDQLYADEAHFIKEDVWQAVTPMLATTGGDIILLSTPFGTTGYFHECFHDDKFKSFHISTEEVAENRKEPQRTMMLEFLDDEKKRYSKLKYQQEYLGLFVGGIMRLFPDNLIKKCMIPDSNGESLSSSLHKECYLGVDIARMGGDDTVLSSFYKDINGNMIMYDLDIPIGQLITATARLIIHKQAQHHYKKIYVDTGGMGVGVFDILLENPLTKKKVVSIDNSHRSIDQEKGKKNPRQAINRKEDLYMNLLKLMEDGVISFLDVPELEQSFRSITYEYSEDRIGRLIITGNYSHIVESIIRAAWATKDKSLKLWAS